MAGKSKGNMEGAEEMVKRLCGRKKVPRTPILWEEANKRTGNNQGQGKLVKCLHKN